MYTMMETCREAGMTYQTLKFYCNEGLVPNVRRDGNKRRVFDKHNLGWIESLSCLKDCGMSIQEMKEYLDLCLQGPSSIQERKVVLEGKRAQLEARIAELQTAIQYIDKKQRFYDEVLSGRREYISDLIPPKKA